MMMAMKEIVKFSVEKGLKKMAVFYQDDAFGNEGLNGTRKALATRGIKPVAEISYKRNSKEFDQALASIAKETPDVVTLWTVNNAGVELATKARVAGIHAVLIGNAAMASSSFAKVAEGAYATLPVPLPEAKFKTAVGCREDAKETGMKTDPAAFQGYVDGALLVEALKKKRAKISLVIA